MNIGDYDIMSFVNSLEELAAASRDSNGESLSPTVAATRIKTLAESRAGQTGSRFQQLTADVWSFV